MKKIVLGSMVVAMAVALVALAGRPASAACGGVFHVGANAEVVSACNGLSEGQKIDGFSIDAKANKIVLKGYNGGAIYYFCRATCDSVKKMEIELVGENTITANSSSAYLGGNGVLQNAAFINIVPKFTGKGTLTIKAGQPIAFEAANSSKFSINVIGADSEKNAADSSEQEPSTTNESSAQESTTTTDESEVAEPSEQESVVTTGEPTAVVKKSDPSFFETPLGIALLIAVPSALVIIILLLVALLKKNGRVKGANDAASSQE